MSSNGGGIERDNEILLDGRSNAAKEAFLERRRKADGLVKAAIALSIFAWVLMFSVWIVMHLAAENEAGIFNVLLGVDVPENPLRATLLPIVFYMLLASLAICVAAFIFNKMRMRRKTDKYRKSIFIIGGITIIAIIAFTINFGFVW